LIVRSRCCIELGEKKLDEAIEPMREAADREDHTEKHVAMENRLSPMRELLGELLLEANRPGEAAREFEMPLRIAPNRFRSLAGAAQAADMSGGSRASTHLLPTIGGTCTRHGHRTTGTHPCEGVSGDAVTRCSPSHLNQRS
jgi:hypothetical protein